MREASRGTINEGGRLTQPTRPARRRGRRALGPPVIEAGSENARLEAATVAGAAEDEAVQREPGSHRGSSPGSSADESSGPEATTLAEVRAFWERYHRRKEAEEQFCAAGVVLQLLTKTGFAERWEEREGAPLLPLLCVAVAGL